MAVDVVQELSDLFENLFGEDAKPEDAAEFVANPLGTLAENGITDASLGGTDLCALVDQAASQADIPNGTREQLQSFGGGDRSAGGSPATELSQHVTQITYTTHQGDSEFNTITESFTTFDNSVDVDIDGDFDGDLDIDNDQDVEQTNVSADDGGVANAGDGDVNAATGEQSQVIDGDNEGVANTGDGAANVGDDGQANTGAGAVQVGDDVEDSLVNTGEVDDSVLTGGDVNAPVVNGDVEDSIVADELDNDGILAGGDIKNEGILADGDVANAVVGDDNQVAQVDGDADGTVFNFGGGDVSNINDSQLDDTAVATGGDAVNISDNEDTAASVGGDAQNISNNDVEDGAIAGDDASNASNNELEEGSALSAGGDAETKVEDSFNEDNDDFEDSFNEQNIDADDSVVGAEQGPGDLDQEDAEVEQELAL